MDKTIMQTFYDLAEDQSTSIAAANLLVDKLQTAAKDLLAYSWKRLVKGMSSNRKNARQGFAVALTEILIQFPDLDVKEVYALCKEVNLPTGHVSQKEIRDLYSGFVFCASALQRSGRLKDSESWEEVLGDLFQILLKKKLTIKDVVFKVLMDILEGTPSEKFPKVFEIFGEELKKGWVECTAERLAIMSYLEMKDNSNASKILKKHWNFSHLHHPHNYENIASVIKGIHCEDRLKPQLSVILDSCTSSSHFKIKKASKFFFSIMESGENKNAVLFSMMHFINCISDEKVESFVGKHMATHLMKALPSSADCITQMTDSVSKRIAKVESSETKVSIAKSLLALSPRRSSCLHKVLDVLFESCPSDVTEECIALLESCFIKNEASSKIEEFRGDCLSWIMKIIRHSSPKIAYQVTKFLFIYSYFEVKGECTDFPHVKPPEPELSQTTLESCKAKFNSCLKQLSIQCTEGSKRKGIADDGRYWLYHLMSSSLSLFTNEQFPMLSDITGFDEWTALWSVIDEIEAKSPDSRSNEEWAFELLFLHIGILFFDEQEQAQIVLNDVFQCYEKHKTGSESDWKPILVDLLISILSYESQMLRNITCECFKMICQDLDNEAIQLIMTALESNSDKDESDAENESESDDMGSEESSNEDDTEDDEDEEEDDEENSEEMEEDDKEVGPDETMESEGAEAADDSEEEEDINLSDADEEELKKVDESLGAAIRGLKDLKKEKQQKKKEVAAKKVKMVHFKVKILDLVEIVVKDIGFSSATMNILPRLLQLVASPTASSGPVYDKVLSILKSIFAMKAEKLTVNFAEALKTDVPAIQDFILKTSNRKAQDLAFQSLFMLCKVHLHSAEPKKKKRKLAKKETPIGDSIFSVFSPILSDFLKNKNTKQEKKTFLQIIERFPIVRPNFMHDATACISEDITMYSKMQAVSIIQRILSFSDKSALDSQDQIFSAVGNLLSKILESEKPSPHHIRECLKLCSKIHAVFTKLDLPLNPLSSDVRDVIQTVGSSEVSFKYPDLANLSKKILSQ